jgi:hypothetical protein
LSFIRSKSIKTITDIAEIMPAIVGIKLDSHSGKLNFDNSWFNIGKIEHAIGDFLFASGETAPSILDFLPDIA